MKTTALKSIGVASLALILSGCTTTDKTATTTNTTTTEAGQTVNSGDSSKTATTSSSSATTSTVNNSNATAGERPTSSTEKTSTASSGDKIGVAECDEYLTKLETCIRDNVPADQKDAMEKSLEQNRAAWKLAASTPVTKPSLAKMCSSALSSAKENTSAYKCKF